MKCYHMTKLENLHSIGKLGLVPKNGKNSKMINDDKVKVFFSEGFEGAIALYVDFNIVYNQIKNNKIVLDDEDLMQEIILSKSLEEYLGKGLYLSFDMNGIINERNFENGCTNQTIFPNNIYVLLLENKENRKISYSRFDIVHYMMSTISPKQIQYYGKTYPNSPSFDEATKKIQNKVAKYYRENKNIIEKYNIGNYQLLEMPLIEFLSIEK